MTIQINKEFMPLCQWLIYNKLSIHIGKDKTKSILFSKAMFPKEIYLCGHYIKQQNIIEYFRHQFDSKLSG